jgi:hypothetical protein
MIAVSEAGFILGPDHRPAGMLLAPDIGLRGIVLGVEGVEVLFEALVGGDTARLPGPRP